ncbi:phosphatidylserine/phosphatidylglycerophosphate/cardiolipin synthase family protein [Neobacillus thermocopriae]|nr:phospholipase D-like domain-containing protein [Neobacillus thermocopriae]
MNVVLIIFGIILIWLLLDFNLGRRKHLSTLRKMESPILHGEFKIFSRGKDLFRDFFTELRRAEKHIHVLFYIVKEDSFSQEFLEILKEKAKEGVEVRLILDRLGSWKVKKNTIKSLRKAGVQCAFINKVKLPFLFYSSQVRNHRKITVIDGRIGYLGGFNIGAEYIDLDPKLSPWRDYHLKITGEGVHFLQQEFLVDWQQCTGIQMLPPITPSQEGEKNSQTFNVPESIRVDHHGWGLAEAAVEFYGGEKETHTSIKEATKHPLVQMEGHLDYFPELPKGKIPHQIMSTEAFQLEEMFIRLIQEAEKSIIIGTPYFIPGKRIMKELLKAIQKGVHLTILVPFVSDHILVQEASYRYLRPLLQAGAIVYQFENGFYHAKALVIDNKICDLGTANFDKRSLYLNKEINCYIYDPAFIDQVKQVIQKDIQDSKRLTLETLNQPNLARTIKEKLAGAISYFL